MSPSPTNPFVLPGFGQTGEQAANPLLASMEMMRQAFSGMSGAASIPGASPLTPTLNPEDLEKRIAELKTVENWLKLNLSMLTSTIQGMEVQLATIQTLKSFVAGASDTKDAQNKQDVPPVAQAWWDMLQQQFGQVAAATAASMSSAAKMTSAGSEEDDASVRKSSAGSKDHQPPRKRAAKKTV